MAAEATVLFNINVDPKVCDELKCDPRYEIKIPSRGVKELTAAIQDESGIPAEQQRLFYRGTEITADAHCDQTLSSLGLTRSSEVYLQTSRPSNSQPIVAYGPLIHPSDQKFIATCVEGLKKHSLTRNKESGTGGTYFIRGTNGDKVACLKPSDEEAGALNNPQENQSWGARVGISPSSQYKREIAARLLDTHGFHGVPLTVCVEVAYNPAFTYRHNNKMTKVGSLQRFVGNQEPKGKKSLSCDIDKTSDIDKKSLPVHDVHKIGILDIRLLNADRNGANIILNRNDNADDEKDIEELIPIDHGLSIPPVMAIDDIDWCWLKMTQSQERFCDEHLQFIKQIDIDNDIMKLRQFFNLDERAIENLRISHMVLTEGAKMGLNLYQIGCMIRRTKYDTPSSSTLEVLISEAKEIAAAKMSQNEEKLDIVDDGIMAMLMQFGYTEREIATAFEAVVDKSDINVIKEYIDEMRENSESKPKKKRSSSGNLMVDAVVNAVRDAVEEAKAAEEQRLAARACFMYYLREKLRSVMGILKSKADEEADEEEKDD